MFEENEQSESKLQFVEGVEFQNSEINTSAVDFAQEDVMNFAFNSLKDMGLIRC